MTNIRKSTTGNQGGNCSHYTQVAQRHDCLGGSNWIEYFASNNETRTAITCTDCNYVCNVIEY